MELALCAHSNIRIKDTILVIMEAILVAYPNNPIQITFPTVMVEQHWFLEFTDDSLGLFTQTNEFLFFFFVRLGPLRTDNPSERS